MNLVSGKCPDTEMILSHLRALLDGKCPENEDLVSNYIFQLGTPTNILVLQSPASLYLSVPPEENLLTVVSHLVSLLFCVIRVSTSRIYGRFLVNIIKLLSLDEVFQIISPESIVECLFDHSTSTFMLDIFYTSKNKICESIAFLFIRHNLTPLFVREVVNLQDTREPVLRFTFDLFSDVAKKFPEMLRARDFEFLKDLPKKCFSGEHHFRNMMAVFCSVSFLDFTRESWAEGMFRFDLEGIIALEARYDFKFDVFYEFIVIFLSWANRVPFNWLTPFLSSFLDVMVAAYPHHDTMSVRYIRVYQKIFSELLVCSGEIRLFLRGYIYKQKSTSTVSNFDVFLDTFLNRVPDKLFYYTFVFGNLDLASGSVCVCQCMIGIIKHHDLFQISVKTKMFDAGILANWPQERLMELFHAMTCYSYSSVYLVVVLGSWFSKYIVTFDSTKSSKSRELQYFAIGNLLKRPFSFGTNREELIFCQRELALLSYHESLAPSEPLWDSESSALGVRR